MPLYREYFNHPFIQEHIEWPGSQMDSYLDKNSWQSWTKSLMENPALNHFEHVFKIAGIEYLFKSAKLFSNSKLK